MRDGIPHATPCEGVSNASGQNPHVCHCSLIHVVVVAARLVSEAEVAGYQGERRRSDRCADFLGDAATAPGVVVTCRALGVLEIDQKKKTGDGRERNDWILAVPECARRFDALRDVFALSARIRDEIAAFFIEARAFEDKDVQVLGWQGPEQALALLGAP